MSFSSYDNIMTCDECHDDYCYHCNSGFSCDSCGADFCENCQEKQEAKCECCEGICKTCHEDGPCQKDEEEE